MLTAAIGAAPGTIDAAYDVERMYEYLDYVHGELMWVVGIRVHPLFGPFKLPGTHFLTTKTKITAHSINEQRRTQNPNTDPTFVNWSVVVMCYDYHGKWDKKTGHNSPLRPRPSDTGDDLTLNVDYTLQYLRQLGARPEKTVLGVPLYGRAFSLVDPAINNIGAPAKDTSFQVSEHVTNHHERQL